MKPRVVFLHGLESGPEGSKVKAIRDAGYSVEAPDMSGMSLIDRVECGFEAVYNGDVSKTVIVGSSYGGAAAVEIADRLVNRGLVPVGCVLCAPALYKDEHPISGDPPMAACRTIIIHGELDSVVPFAWSRGWAGGQSKVSLITVDDGHRLNESHEFIIRAIDTLWEMGDVTDPDEEMSLLDSAYVAELLSDALMGEGISGACWLLAEMFRKVSLAQSKSDNKLLLSEISTLRARVDELEARMNDVK
jgi:pimeloyl-ACP methyl ester carboxylesterase